MLRKKKYKILKKNIKMLRKKTNKILRGDFIVKSEIKKKN